MMANYVITGGAGFIGSNLTEAILRGGDAVRVLDNFSSGRRENLVDAAEWARRGGTRFELVEGDIRDASVCRAVIRGADYVLHLAAVPSVQRSVVEPLETNGVNVTGTLNLLEAAREAGVKRFVFASSSSVYGESDVLPKVETMAPAPISPYALQKLTGETYCLLYHRLYRLPAIALRYFNVFGPRQDPSSDYAAVVPRFIDAIRRGRPPTIFGDGEQTRDFTYVANAVRANLLACSAPEVALGQAFNVASGTRVSLNELLATLVAIAGVNVRAQHEAARPGDVRHSLAGLEKASARLGYRPEVDFGEGLRLVWDTWAR